MNISPSSLTIITDNVRFLDGKILFLSLSRGIKRSIIRMSNSLSIISWCWSRSKVKFSSILFGLSLVLFSFCGIITHCADNSFKYHVFHCLPSCVQLWQNIEVSKRITIEPSILIHLFYWVVNKVLSFFPKIL